jgi:hypothetical protein
LSYYTCTGGTLWHLQKCPQYILTKFTPSIFLLYSALLKTVSTGLVPFSYMNTWHFHHMHPPLPFPYALPPLRCNRYIQDLFCLPVLHFFKKIFCLLMMVVHGVSLWHFLTYMYYTLNCFISSIILLSPLLMMISAGLNVLSSHLYKEYVNHFHLLYFPYLLSPSH